MLWFAWKYLPLWYQQQRTWGIRILRCCCDLLENIYLCGINNNGYTKRSLPKGVVICLKISTFVVSTTTGRYEINSLRRLWFAWKYLPLWYQQQRNGYLSQHLQVVICLKISTFVVSTTTMYSPLSLKSLLWFAWKYLPLWYQQQLHNLKELFVLVVICLKISTFVVSTTTNVTIAFSKILLWFAWKYLPLWYQQQRVAASSVQDWCVICLKISTFVESTTKIGHKNVGWNTLWFAWKYLPFWYQQQNWERSYNS